MQRQIAAHHLHQHHDNHLLLDHQHHQHQHHQQPPATQPQHLNHMEHLQLHHRRPPDHEQQQLHLAQHQHQSEHYPQQYQHDNQEQQQQQLVVGLQQHYQLQQEPQPSAELACNGPLHYGYNPVAYASHQPAPAGPVPDQYEQPTSGPGLQEPAGEHQVDQVNAYRLASDLKAPLVDEWELVGDHHLHSHHPSSFAYINNYPFNPHQAPAPAPSQQQHEHHQAVHLLAPSQPPLLPSQQQEQSTEQQVQQLLAEPPNQQQQQQQSPPVLANGLQPEPPASQRRVRAPRTRSQLCKQEQVANTNGTQQQQHQQSATDSAARQRRKQSAVAAAGSPAEADQLEGKYPRRLSIGQHEEIEYLRDGLVARNHSLGLQLSFTNEELAEVIAKSLNRRLSKFSNQLTTLVKGRRRTLKNRGYAAHCRTKREAAKKSLEKENEALRAQNNKLCIEVSQLREKLQLALSASCTCLRQQISQMVL